MKQPHGQNFLVEKNIALKILTAAGITSTDKVIEIGPGKGILTGLIAPVAGQLKAIEIDKNLFENLKLRFATFENTSIILADFLRYSFSEEEGPLKIVSNLPYNVSTAIIEKFLPENNWTTAVIMVQKEVGERLTAAPGTKDYGSFTIICRHYAQIKKLFSVGPGCFFPKPRVDSVVLKLTNLCSGRLESLFIQFIKSAFSQRRKTALNSISSALNLSKPEVLKAFEASRVDTSLRPENLDIGQFDRIYKTLPFPPVE